MNDQLNSPGIRIKNPLNVIIGEHEKIRCLRDYMVVEPLDWTPSKLIIVAGYQGEALRGIVRTVGPGRYLIEYQDALDGHWGISVPKGRRIKSRDSKIFRLCEVKVGDIVEFGGLELKGFLHPTILLGTKEMVLCREEDVAGIAEDENPRCECGCQEFTTGQWSICMRCNIYQEGPFKGLKAHAETVNG